LLTGSLPSSKRFIRHWSEHKVRTYQMAAGASGTNNSVKIASAKCQVFTSVLPVSGKIASAFMQDEMPFTSNANDIQGGSYGRKSP